MRRSRGGSLLLEAIIAIGIFAIFLGGIGFSLIFGERSTISGGDRTAATYLAEQQLEGIRAMRATSFASVVTGTHGVALKTTGWAYSGTSVVQNGYRSKVEVLSRGTDWLEITAIVSWNFGQTRSGSTTLSTYLTNWKKPMTVGNWGAFTQVAKLTDGGTPDYDKIVVSGNYAYVTSSHAAGGKGLYIFDISNLAVPVRVASAFDLGASAYGLAVNGTLLFVATDDPTREIQIFDISSPATFSAANQLGTYDLTGGGLARSIAVNGQTLFIGAADSAGTKQLTAINVTTPASATLLNSISMTGSALSLSLNGKYLYAATSNNSGEFVVVDISDPAHLKYAPSVGIDLTDVQDGTAMLTSGTAALVGRMYGASISALAMYSTEATPVPTTPPGPWTMDPGGSVLDVSCVPGTKYGFLGSDAASAQLRTLDLLKLEQNGSSILKAYDVEETVKGLWYNWQNDRLFAVTPTSLIIFAPG